MSKCNNDKLDAIAFATGNLNNGSSQVESPISTDWSLHCDIYIFNTFHPKKPA